VIDWFNGRATAYDAQSGGDPVEADWTNGRTGLVGGSANGELANGLATTGVDGLDAIVAKAANNGQYSLFRSNGTPISPVPDETEGITDLGTWIQAGNALRPACAHWTDRVEAGQDRRTGDYNDFWHEREFLPDADAVDCAVLLSGAVDDPIVKPNNVADWYEMLEGADVPRRLWLHKGGHSSPRSPEWRELVERWWDHWLKDRATGVMDEPPVTVNHGGASSADGSLDTYPSWPVPSAEPVRLQFGSDGTSIGAMHVEPLGSVDTASFVDAPTVPLDDLLPSGDPTHRLRYETPPVWKAVQVSGKVVPSLSVSLDEPTVISAALVESNPSGTDVVARGWADPLNRPAYGEYDSPVAYKQSLRESRPLSADEQVRVEFPLQATDHVFDPGSRLGLVVYASDREFTLHPPGNATVSVDVGASSVAVPVAGGGAELADAFRADGRDGAGSPTTASGDPGANGSASTAPASNGTDGAGPGFGIGSALAAIGGVVATVCRRRLTGEDRRE
jgi:X-Pro dipeptidyl-peptidase